jgi:hypothetical protein
MAAPSFACCPAPGDKQQLDGLACRFDEHSVEAHVDGGEVRCTPPAAEVLRGTYHADQWAPGRARQEWRAGRQPSQLLLLSLSQPAVELACSADLILRPPVPMQTLFQDAERQGVRMRVTAPSVGAAAAAAMDQQQLQELHDEYLDRAAFEERAALAASAHTGDGGALDASAPPPPERQLTMSQRYSALKPFVIISVSYLLFTVTDGAIRMVVLLHAYQKGFTAMEVAVMFSFYEVGGDWSTKGEFGW